MFHGCVRCSSIKKNIEIHTPKCSISRYLRPILSSVGLVMFLVGCVRRQLPLLTHKRVEPLTSTEREAKRVHLSIRSPSHTGLFTPMQNSRFKKRRILETQDTPTPPVPGQAPTPTKNSIQEIDLRLLNQSELCTLAREKFAEGGNANSAHATLSGILEAVSLPSGRKNCAPFTLGCGVEQHPMCARAWKSISEGAGVRSFDKFDGLPIVGEIGGVPQYVLTVVVDKVPEEFRPFLKALEGFLQRKIELPILSSTELLDLRKLFVEVMSSRGYSCVTSTMGWPTIAQRVLLDARLGDCLKQVYQYYLLPLEELFPDSIRPSRAVEWLEQTAKRKKFIFSPHLKTDGTFAAAWKRLREPDGSVDGHTVLGSVCGLARDPLRLVDGAVFDCMAVWGEADEVQGNVQGEREGSHEENRKDMNVGEEVVKGATGPKQKLDQDGEVSPHWLLLCSHRTRHWGGPCASRLLPPVLKPPVSFPIHMPFSLLASTGISQKTNGKRTMLADATGRRIVTPKCGVCRTCLNPRLKKACLTNRDRLAKGMEPLIEREAPKLKGM